LKADLYQMVLHRPVETTALTGEVESPPVTVINQHPTGTSREHGKKNVLF
jgi:hypothetical protein